MLSFIVPVFRSSSTLSELHRRISLAFSSFDGGFEIIFVEDHGRDSSWVSIQELAAADPRVRGIRLSRNFGQHSALLCGIRNASGTVLVTLDDDLQHPPEEIPKLLELLGQGFDVVYGTALEERHGVLRNRLSRLVKFFLRYSVGAESALEVSALRAFRAELRSAFEHFGGPTVNIDVLLIWATSSIGSVSVRRDPRRIGKSGYSVLKLVKHALNMLTGFSTRPLQLASLVGLFVSAFGFFILLYILALWWIQGSVVPGFYFLGSMIAIFSGIQLLAVGVIGEYLARMYTRTIGKPTYFVSEVTSPSKDV